MTYNTFTLIYLTVDADPSTCIDALDVQACLLLLNVWIIVTVHSVAVAVAG
jgi:hypothetical protein